MPGITINKDIKKKSPCLNCPDRFPGCHGKCETYAAWKEPFVRIREIRARENEADNVAIERVKKANRERRRKNG
jgi:hypothetical protein